MFGQKITYFPSESDNFFDDSNQNLFLQNNFDILLPFNTFHYFDQNNDEEAYLEEMKKKIDEYHGKTESEINDIEANESLYFLQKKEMQKIESNSIINNLKTTSERNTFITCKESMNKKVQFKTILHHKRGRKTTAKFISKYPSKYHGSSDFDNIQRKIQVNYITFLIRLANDAIKTVLGKNSKYFFKDIKYKYKKVVNYKYVEKLKQLKISDIIQMERTTKGKNYEKNLNKEIFLEICQISPKLQNFFDKNYLYIFQKYYYGLKKDQNIIDCDGLKIQLSPTTKGFYELLRKNDAGKDSLNKVVNDVYFSGTSNIILNNHNSNPFIITSFE